MLSANYIKTLAEYSFFDEISGKDLKNLGYGDLRQYIFSLPRFSDSSYYVASIMSGLVGQDSSLSSEFPATIPLKDFSLKRLGDLELDQNIIKKTLDDLIRTGAVAQANQSIPLHQVDIVLQNYLRVYLEEEREKLFMIAADYVKFVAALYIGRLQSTVHEEDLQQVGYLGLLDALERFDAIEHKHFPYYVKMKVNGAILDELRKMDYLNHHQRKKVKSIERARNYFRGEGIDEPTDLQLMERAGLSPQQYYQVLPLVDVKISSMDSTLIVDFMEGGSSDFIALESVISNNDPDLLDQVIHKQRLERMFASIEELPEKQKTIINLYHGKGIPIKDISSLLKINPCRVSQLHSQALLSLRKKIRRMEMPIYKKDYETLN